MMNYFQLIERLNRIYQKNLDKELSSLQITQKIKQAIPFKDCKILCINTLALQGPNFQVSGVYDPDQDRDGDPGIEIEILFPKKRERFKFNELDVSEQRWNNLIVDIVCILGSMYTNTNFDVEILDMAEAILVQIKIANWQKFRRIMGFPMKSTHTPGLQPQTCHMD